MKLPFWLISFLPKSWQHNQIQKHWDAKTDEQILFAYEDAFGWIRLANGILATETMRSVADSCKDRLDRYIKPQIDKRNIVLDK